MKIHKTYFITGAEGVGKSTIYERLKQKFLKIDIHDFDSVGVPLHPPLQWRLDTTQYWISKAVKNQNDNIQTCIIGLSFPNEVKSMEGFGALDNVFFILLDVDKERRRKRLMKRNASKEVIEDIKSMIELKKQIKAVEGKIIDTSFLSVDEVCNEIIKLFRKDGEFDENRN